MQGEPAPSQKQGSDNQCSPKEICFDENEIVKSSEGPGNTGYITSKGDGGGGERGGGEVGEPQMVRPGRAGHIES